MHTNIREQTIDDAASSVRPQIERAKRQAKLLGDKVASAIQDHPAVFLLGALVLGFFVARVARRRS